LNIDLGSPILDIAVAMSFIFFLLSLIVSAVGEFITGAINLRGKYLLKGIKGMIGDAKIAKDVFDHPLVRTNGMKGTHTGLLAGLRNIERKPAYVSASNFARALLAVAKANPKPATPPEPGVPSAKFLWEQLEALDVQGLPREAKADLDKIEKWFDDSMDRVSGWYKRRSRWITFGIAAIVAFGLNANTLRIAERLDQDPSTRAAVVSAAEESLANGSAVETGAQKEEANKKEEAGEEPTPTAVVEIKNAGEHLSTATKELTALNLPLFWNEANSLSSIAWWKTVLGLLMTAIAISLGAPFWFDALGKISNLRSAGKRPEEDPKAAK
jgi:hypothetical protein